MITIDKVTSFLRQNKDNKFIQYRLNGSNIKIDDICTYDDFKKIKPITRKDLAELTKDIKVFADFFDSCPIKIFESPGPIYNLLFESYYQYRFYKGLEYSSFGHCDIVVNTFSYHLTPAGEMFDEAVRKIGASVIPLGPSSSSKCAEVIKNTGATAFIGTKTFLKKVLEELGEKNSLLKSYLIAEKITDDERNYLSNKYDIEIYQGYGTAEAGLIATECQYKTGMHVDNEIFVEILNPENGDLLGENEVGEAYVTILNKNYPLIRYATGDLVSYTLEKCSCDREDMRILGVFGRVDSSVKVKGVFIHEWSLTEFANSYGVSIKLEISNDENNNDILSLHINKDVKGLDLAFKEKFKLRVNNINVNNDINKTEIIENRTYLKKR
ncbi:MAG: phenylacetate-CoA ligase [Deferribacteraceae bacterium]|jgi:phenylacetate-CoA ligase|nr:phenylacetate-CoA ligase [Deferribacteraceae bacterium]